MHLKFVNPRTPQHADELSPIEQAQLVAAGRAYDGEELSAHERLSDEPELEEQSFLGFLQLWDVIDEDADGAHVYTYFSYMVDSGAFFQAGTTAYDADVIQFYLHNPRTEELGQALTVAMRRQADELGSARFDSRY